MCLGIPHEVVDVLDGDRCTIRLGNATQHCFVGLVEDLKPGDWVVVHAGFAIDKIAPEDARANLKLIETYLQPETRGDGSPALAPTRRPRADAPVPAEDAGRG